MEGYFLRLYVHENPRCHGRPAWEWLLAHANEVGVRGGSAFRAMEGSGRGRLPHEDRFLESTGGQAAKAGFIATRRGRQRLLELPGRGNGRVFCAEMRAPFGVPSPEAANGTSAGGGMR